MCATSSYRCRCGTGSDGCQVHRSTTSLMVCTTAIPAPLIVFPRPSSQFPAVVTFGEPGCVAMPKAGCPGSPPRVPYRTGGPTAIQRAVSKFNTINNPLMAIERTFPRNKFLPHQKEATNQCTSRPFLTMGTRLATVGSISWGQGTHRGRAVPPCSPHGREHQPPP